eukprot:s1603_g14.t1
MCGRRKRHVLTASEKCCNTCKLFLEEHICSNVHLLLAAPSRIPRAMAETTSSSRKSKLQKATAEEHPGNHKASNSTPGPTWWCEAHQRAHLRGNPRCLENLPGERAARLDYLHRACAPQNSYGNGHCLCSEAPGSHHLRLWWIAGGRAWV